ncbi:hypothetical protein Sango_1897200 [Sesamum angolense]|uniref:CCHC-type domain-containing protein n=1 Tax=Sesamum angolense TaxID=2727404 RepID=A0AAE2BQQ1_9LAMI|nr:hypothetical protein Sango_1897200 [Sesamum angolense]
MRAIVIASTSGRPNPTPPHPRCCYSSPLSQRLPPSPNPPLPPAEGTTAGNADSIAQTNFRSRAMRSPRSGGRRPSPSPLGDPRHPRAGIENDTYLDVFLQSLSPSYDPFFVNFNMNGLEKSIPEYFNMLVQFEATIKRSKLAVMLGEASTSKKGKRARRWKKKKSKTKCPTLASKPVVKGPAVDKGKRNEVPEASKAEDICHYCHEKGHWKRNCPKSLHMSKRMGLSLSGLLLERHSLNGVSERRNRTLLDMVQSMMSFTELPLFFWGYTLKMAAKLLNMTPSKTVIKTPHEI